MKNIIDYTSSNGEFSSTSWKRYEQVKGEKPFRYVCNECGCVFYTAWHSQYSIDKVKCPICGEHTDPLFIDYRSGDFLEEDDMPTDYSLESLKTLIDKSGDLDLSSSDISELPEGLDVPRTLNIENTNISSLPCSLKIGKGLVANHTKITSLPKGLTHIHGDLALCGCSISSLPDSLTVEGNLFLNGSSLKALPNHLNVGGCLYIERTSIVALPSDISVEGHIYAKDTHLEDLNGFDKRYISTEY